MNKNKLTASKENYIKAISKIVKEKKAARVKDISKYLNIGPSSVSEALKSLSEDNYINYEPYGIITLTDEGEKTAQGLEERHEIICNFLSNVLLIDENILDESAMQIEYGIKGDILDKLVSFFHFMQICPCKEPKWLRGYKAYSLNNEVAQKCSDCISYCKENNLTKPFPDNHKKTCCNSCD